MKEFSLRKDERLRLKKDFLRIVKQGRRYSTKNFLIIIYSQKLEKRRLGVSVSKKVGKAVERNRVKRLLREFFRLNKTILPVSCDILLIAKPGAKKLSYHQILSELSGFFKKDDFVN